MHQWHYIQACVSPSLSVEIRFVSAMKFIYCLLPIFATLASAAPAFAVVQGKIFKDPLGAIYVYGLVADEGVLSVNAFPPARTIRSDNCGLIRLRPLNGKPNGRIKFEGATIEPATLPTLLAPVVVAAPIACHLGNSVRISNLPQLSRHYQLQASSFNFRIRNSGTTKTATFTNMTVRTQAFIIFGTFTLRDLTTSQTIATFQPPKLAFCQ